MRRTSARFIRTFASAAVLVFVASSAAEAGVVAGKVLDSTTSLPLAGVEVLVDGQPTGVTTDFMGQFKTEVAAGDRLFTFRRAGYSEQSQGPVPVPAEGETSVPDSKLAPASADDDVVMLDAMTVQGDLVKGSAGDLQNTRLQADVAIDFLTADEFAKFGAGDIAESLIRVPGVSVVGGQFAVIRGLSDRYVTTTLNGLKIPSPDPERQSPQMDLLPTTLVDSLVVSKTFAPQLWAETSGGGIDLASKSFPDERQITVSYGMKVNENALDGGPAYSVPRERNDLLARGSKSRPSALPEFAETGSQSWSSPRQYALGRDSELPPGQKIGLGYGETFTWGDAKKLGVVLSGSHETSNRARSGFKQKLLLQNSASPAASEYASGLPTQLDGGTYDYTQAEREVQIGLLANVGLELNPEHRFRVTSFYTRSGIDTAEANVGRIKLYEQGGSAYVVGFDQGEQDAAYSDGFVPQSARKYRDTQRYTERELRVNQIGGEHTFPTLADLEFKWTLQASSTYQDDAASAEAVYYEQLGGNPIGSNDHGIQPGNIGIAANQGGDILRRFWGRTDEDQVADRYDFTLPYEVFEDRESRLRFGAAREDTDRTYRGKSDNYSDKSVLLGADDRQVPVGGDINEVFNNLVDLQVDARTSPSITQQSRNINAAYVGTDFALPAKFQLQGGARFENYEIATAGRDIVENISTGSFYHAAASDLLGTEFNAAYAGGNPDPTNPDFSAGPRDHVTRVSFADETWYPSVGFVYSPTKRVNFRINFSQTSGRPSLRELGPYYNRSLETGDYVIGNPNLRPSDVDNYDFRAEWFAEDGTMAAFSLFAKTIASPIEKVYLPGFLSGQSVETWVNNPNEADLRGVEVEARLGLGRLAEELSSFSVGGNVSFIDAEVEELPQIVQQLRNNGHVGADETVTRRLYDQPEYLINTDLTWTQGRWGTTVTLAANFTSDVLAASGGGVLGVSESSLDLYTRAHERIDFFVSQKLWDGWKLRVGVKNLTDPVRGTIYDPERTAGTIVRNEYRAGREYSVSVSAQF